MASTTGQAENPFCKSITADGSSGYLAEPNRYHLYTSNVCPFAQRSLIVRKLKGLDEVIPVTITWKFDDKGWAFTDKIKHCTLDPINNFSHLRDVYQLNVPGYTGTVSVPTLFDKTTNRVVNNESAELMQMFNSEFNKLAKYPDIDLYPQDLRAIIDDLNSNVISKCIFNQYKALGAKTQEDYEIASSSYFAALDKFEEILSTQRYLCGDQLTDSDVRLYVVLVRFDPVYYVLAKLNMKRITDYPNLLGYIRELYQIPAFSESIDLELLKESAYNSPLFKSLVNPSGIISKGPFLDLTVPHGREKLPGKPF